MKRSATLVSSVCVISSMSLLAETAEDYCLVHTVEKLRSEGRAQLLHDAAAHRLTVGLRTAGEAELRAIFSVIAFAPMFEVITMTVFEKSMRRPAESVRRPSSMI